MVPVGHAHRTGIRAIPRRHHGDLGVVEEHLLALAALGVLLLAAETIHRKRIDEVAGRTRRQKTAAVLAMVNPGRPLRQLRQLGDRVEHVQPADAHPLRAQPSTLGGRWADRTARTWSGDAGEHPRLRVGGGPARGRHPGAGRGAVRVDGGRNGDDSVGGGMETEEGRGRRVGLTV